MNALIPVISLDGAPVADSRAIAIALEIQHENLLGNLDAHQATIEAEFGHLRFQTGTVTNSVGAVNRTRYACLTENQALFAATLSRNSAAVVRVKAAIINAFADARTKLALAPVPTLPQNYTEAVRALLVKCEENDRLALTVAELEPKAAFFDAVADSKTAIEMATVAKVLAFPNVGRTKLFAFLREKKVLRKDNSPYQEFCDRGYFRVVEQKWTTPEGEVHISYKTLVYQRGLDFIRQLLAERATNLQLAPTNIAALPAA